MKLLPRTGEIAKCPGWGGLDRDGLVKFTSRFKDVARAADDTETGVTSAKQREADIHNTLEPVLSPPQWHVRPALRNRKLAVLGLKPEPAFDLPMIAARRGSRSFSSSRA